MSARTDEGISEASWNMAAMRAVEGWMPRWTSCPSDVLGGEVLAGDAAGKEPMVGAAGVGRLPAAGEVGQDEPFEGLWRSMGTVSKVTVTCPSSPMATWSARIRVIPRQGLGEQKGEQACDADV